MDGHQRLIHDLEALTAEARGFEFDDFRNSKYPAPKVELVAKLRALVDNTIKGKYDN